MSGHKEWFGWNQTSMYNFIFMVKKYPRDDDDDNDGPFFRKKL